MKGNEVYDRLTAHGIKPSVQRLEIMKYLMTHHTHPTVEDVYTALCKKMPTLSRTTVYNTLRMFAEHKAAQMLTIDERRVCYDYDTSPHVHLFCRNCGKVMDSIGQSKCTIRKGADSKTASYQWCKHFDYVGNSK